MVSTGKNVSHYRIHEKLGGGGMGVVYRAHDEHLDRDVALKVLPAGLLSDESARSRFRREALTLSHLNHPGIAVIHDFDSENDVDFLTMEYVKGETLAAKAGAGPLPEKDVVALGTQIAEALEEAHAHKVIHRDLKPANVMVTAKGRVKVLDFGLAKLVKPPEADAATASLAESQPGVVMGTVPYIAPEQLEGKAVDARADVYALGAVLYEMATGRRPFPEKQLPQLIAAILTRTPQTPRELNSQVSPGLEAIILKALEKNPDERYQSAREVLEDLGRLSIPGSMFKRPRRLTTRRWALAAIAATVALMVILALFLGLHMGGLRNRLSGQGRFEGGWKVGDGAGGTFFITLKRDGTATKTIGPTHGTWKVVNGEARISWNDGWHDAIRRRGDAYQKVAFAPGRTFSDEPSNVTQAESLKPI